MNLVLSHLTNDMKSNSSPCNWLCSLMACCLPLGITRAAEPIPADPLADKVLEQNVSASGGTDAFRQITSRRVTGNVERHGAKVPFLRLQKAPNHLRVETLFPRPGTLKQGFDGRDGWVQHPLQGGRRLAGEELAALAADAWLHPVLHFKDQFPQRRLLPPRTIDGRNLTVLSMSRGTTGDPELWFFDPVTFLLARVERQMDGGKHGKIPVVIALEDYRKVDGVMMPFTVRTKLADLETVLHTDSVEHNVSLGDELFRPPF